MAGEFQKLPVKKYQKHDRIQPAIDIKYWKKFQFPRIVKEYSAINCIDFSSAEPHNYVVTCSGKVQVFSAKDNEIIKTSSRSKENVYGARFRADGNLIISGGESGLVQIIASKSKAILRNLKGHTKATHTCCFTNDVSSVFSGSDDKTARIWDIATSKQVSLLQGHEDYVRCGSILPSSTDMFLTGSYDHKAKIWDRRTGEVCLSVDHGQPVESVLVYKSGATIYTAGGNYIRVWDVLRGGRLVQEISNHQKTISTLCFDGEHTRLLSASLDRHVKVYDVQDYSLVAGLDYPSPILSMGLSPTGSHLVVGMSDGAISIRTQPEPSVDALASERKKTPRTGTYQHFTRGQNNKPAADDIVIDSRRSARKPSKLEQMLRRFRYSEALDSVLLGQSVEPAVAIAMMTELSRRGALLNALSNRDVPAIRPILKFISRYISNPKYSRILVKVAHIVIDMYAGLIGQCAEFDRSLLFLQQKLRQLLQAQTDMMHCLGALDTVFAMATVKNHGSATFAVLEEITVQDSIGVGTGNDEDGEADIDEGVGGDDGDEDDDDDSMDEGDEDRTALSTTNGFGHVNGGTSHLEDSDSKTTVEETVTINETLEDITDSDDQASTGLPLVNGIHLVNGHDDGVHLLNGHDDCSNDSVDFNLVP